MDKIRKKSKTMLALLLCALSVAALIPDAAPAYADNAEYAEESTETGSGLDESMQELDAENRLIVRTDAEYAGRDEQCGVCRPGRTDVYLRQYRSGN